MEREARAEEMTFVPGILITRESEGKENTLKPERNTPAINKSFFKRLEKGISNTHFHLVIL